MKHSTMTQVLFMAHGWGYNHHFFDAFLNKLSDKTRTQTLLVCLEAGYFPEQAKTGLMLHIQGRWIQHPIQTLNTLLLSYTHLPWLGLGHSMGFSKLLDLPIKWHSLICLHGFTHFIQNEQHREGTANRVLRHMARKAEQNITQVLNTFHERCGHVPYFDSANQNTLLTDLNHMHTINCASALQAILAHGTDFYAWAAKNDNIVPLPLSQTCFHNLLSSQGRSLQILDSEHAAFANQPELYTETLLPLLHQH